MTALTDLIAELAEVARLIRKDNAGAGQWGMPSAAVNYLRTHHAELTRILTDDAAIRAAHHDLVIRLGEVTTELEAANALLREIMEFGEDRELHIRIQDHLTTSSNG